jgi:hypothetical protein
MPTNVFSRDFGIPGSDRAFHGHAFVGFCGCHSFFLSNSNQTSGEFILDEDAGHAVDPVEAEVEQRNHQFISKFRLSYRRCG